MVEGGAKIICVDIEGLGEICKRVSDEFKKKNPFGLDGIKNYLPEFNLPLELDFDPPRIEVPDPLTASKYLFLLASMERKSQSRINIRNGLFTWAQPSKRWVFDPVQVIVHPESEIESICRRDLQHGLDNFHKRYKKNCATLVKDYGGYPRILINNQTVDQARANLMELDGIGTGIANLYIHYLLDRKIASPTNPEDALLKVDIHKGALPFNIVCADINENTIRGDIVTEVFEPLYRQVIKRQGLDPSLLDSGLWFIGSEECNKEDYNVCLAKCPLVDMCRSRVPQDYYTKHFTVYDLDSDGNRVRIDRRKHRAQTRLIL